MKLELFPRNDRINIKVCLVACNKDIVVIWLIVLFFPCVLAQSKSFMRTGGLCLISIKTQFINLFFLRVNLFSKRTFNNSRAISLVKGSNPVLGRIC